MNEPVGSSPRETSLIGRHLAAGARLIDFAGWNMPVQYSGILDEHRAVRERAGLFDLSHMGELVIEGPDAGPALARALVTDPPALAIGRAHYSMICQEDGGIIDDLIVYRLAEDSFLVVANASNAEVVSDELTARLGGERAVVDDRSDATALVAIQGPRARAILRRLTPADLDGLRYYGIVPADVAGIPSHIARTGYTGEDGFEVFVDWASAVAVWDAALDAGSGDGLIPCGLGARDTLRLEAGMPLYGNELDRDTTPFDAGLGRIVRFDKEDRFVGRVALERAALEGPRKRLVGLAVRGRGIARHGYPVMSGDQATGVVTSGAPSPTLGLPIAMAYVAPGDGEPDTMLDVVVRDQRVEAQVVPLPFYRRQT